MLIEALGPSCISLFTHGFEISSVGARFVFRVDLRLTVIELLDAVFQLREAMLVLRAQPSRLIRARVATAIEREWRRCSARLRGRCAGSFVGTSGEQASREASGGTRDDGQNQIPLAYHDYLPSSSRPVVP
jgi:hypothetical protein